MIPPNKKATMYFIRLLLPAGEIQPSLEEIANKGIDAAKELGLTYYGVSWEDLEPSEQAIISQVL